MVATIPPEHAWPFEFHVVAQKDINAFALPGRQMFVNIGTITAAANEGELAGVMAHEIFHEYMQHSAKQASKAQTREPAIYFAFSGNGQPQKERDWLVTIPQRDGSENLREIKRSRTRALIC